MRYDVLALATLFFFGLAWLYRRDQARARAIRMATLEPCAALLEDAKRRVDRAGFPVLSGRYKGFPVRLECLVDAVAVRKLPQLLVKVTLLQELPVKGMFDVMMRAHNVEFYSPAGELPHALRRPANWPEHATLRSDREDRRELLARLDPHVGIFDDDKVKELLVTPRGLRIVYRLDEAERPYYLVLRQAQFVNDKAEPEKIRELLDALIALQGDLAEAATPPAPRRAIA